MGKRGPKPTPTKVLEARGSWRAKTRPAEPEAPSTKPVCPKGKSKKWVACWTWLTTQLEAMTLLSTAEEKDIARYCDAQVLYDQAVAEIDSLGLVLKLYNNLGQIVSYTTNPQIAVRAKLSQELLRLGQQFGLNPSARAGLGATVRPPAPKEGAKHGTVHYFDQHRQA